MANKNLPTQVPTPTTTPASTSLLYIVDDPYGTPADNATTIANAVQKGHGLSAGLVKAASGSMSVVAAPAGAVVGTSDSQALSNKDLTAGTNTFPTLNQDTTGKSAKTDALNSASTVVNVAAATAPTSGQVLTATDSTHATWQSPGAAAATPRFVFNSNFPTLASASVNTAGTGAVVKAGADTRLNSGATAASAASIDNSDDAFNFQSVFNRNPAFWIQGFMAGPVASQTYTTYMTFGWLGDAANAPIQTGAVYFGFKYVVTLGVGVLSSCHSDGTHGETLTTLAGIDTTNSNLYYANMTSGTNIKFYVNGTLAATHSTNLPSGAQLFSAAHSCTFKRTAGTTSMTVLNFNSIGFSFDAF